MPLFPQNTQDWPPYNDDGSSDGDPMPQATPKPSKAKIALKNFLGNLGTNVAGGNRDLISQNMGQQAQMQGQQAAVPPQQQQQPTAPISQDAFTQLGSSLGAFLKKKVAGNGNPYGYDNSAFQD